MSDEAKIKLIVAHCPYRKNGSPVLGSFGATIKPVVLFELDEWKRLCKLVPALADMEFDVGSFQ